MTENRIEKIAKKLCELMAGKTTPNNWKCYIDAAQQIADLFSQPEVPVLAERVESGQPIEEQRRRKYYIRNQ